MLVVQVKQLCGILDKYAANVDCNSLYILHINYTCLFKNVSIFCCFELMKHHYLMLRLL